MNLIKINLLPYRELQEQKRKKQFQSLMLFGALAGIGIAAAIYVGLVGIIEHQNSRNEALQSGIAELDKQIAEIKKLNEQKRNFLARKQKVEELDIKRFEGARMLDTLNQIVPEGSYLISLEPVSQSQNATGTSEYILTGRAVSDNKVALFMNALPSTGIFDLPRLNGIKKVDDAQEFAVTTKLIEQQLPKVEDVSGTAQAASTPAQ
ncbi:MAG: PilN domain-containing protein [Alysiella sp.]|uniref:PilN domain-containing protein n=1 Tax=Alysiella sp. TaxID=1872483 RepID=UPI0026DA79E4|nr:PilN domain-containing protein [Alysiella sp.]MDO4434173.1 PilN domain-containing protein [Alysiella sp.]